MYWVCKTWGNYSRWDIFQGRILIKEIGYRGISKCQHRCDLWSLINMFVNFIPEVSWVRLLLEGMEGFPSPFESLRTILWYWSHFSVGLYDVKYNPTEKQLVILLSLLLLKKEPPPPGIEPGTIRSEARRSTRWAIEA